MGRKIIATCEQPIEERLGALLREHHLTMATAESCTGGNIAGLMTSVPGSSDYFLGGIVSYCNLVKQQVLGVDENDLREQGAVSRPVVEQMVRGAMRVIGADCAVATSGVAGPGGGTPTKPVGTVWIAAACGERLISQCCHFGPRSRQENIQASMQAALALLEDLLHTESEEKQ